MQMDWDCVIIGCSFSKQKPRPSCRGFCGGVAVSGSGRLIGWHQAKPQGFCHVLITQMEGQLWQGLASYFYQSLCTGFFSMFAYGSAGHNLEYEFPEFSSSS